MADLSRPATPLLDLIRQRPLVGDGGMGTQLIEAGLSTGECGVGWNLDNPEAIQRIHEAYRDAGCDLITTNTFQGSAHALMMHNLQDKVSQLNEAGARLARQAAGDQAYVLADLGPFGGFLEPLGDASREDVIAMFTDQLQALLHGGADAALIETMTDPGEVGCAIEAARNVSDWPVIATYAFDKSADGTSFNTMMGTTAADSVKQSIDSGAHVVGANCGTALDLDDYKRLAQQLIEAAGDTPVMIQPNAGSPIQVDGKTVHPATPQQMAPLAQALVDAGVRIVGGCCGTTPAHLAAMAQQIKASA